MIFNEDLNQKDLYLIFIWEYSFFIIFISGGTNILNNNNHFANKYAQEDVKKFNTYIDEHISRLNTDKEFIHSFLMEMYANPVKNFYNE